MTKTITRQKNKTGKTLTKQILEGPIIDTSELENLTDSQLYQKCREYGLNSKKWLRKFAGLLPEVKKRRLYKRRSCASIYQFAAKLAGMSERKVDKILNIYKKIEDKPHLKKLLISGQVGWSKLELVAFIANSKTESKWAKKVTEMPTQALQVFVQEHRKREDPQAKLTEFKQTVSLTDIGQVCHEGGTSQINLLEQNALGNNIPEKEIKLSFDKNSNTSWTRLSCMLDPEIEFKLRLRKQQIEKHKRETLSWNEVFTEITKHWDTTSPLIKRIPKEKEINWGTY